MKKLDTKQKTLIISLVFSFGFLLFAFFIIYPVLKRIKNYSSKLSLVENELTVTAQRTKDLYAWKEEYPILNPKVEELHSLFIDKETPVDFIEFLEKTADGCGLNINISLVISNTGKQEKEVSAFLPLGFRLSLIGPFSAHLRFLEKLENAPYTISTEMFSFSQLLKVNLDQEEYKGFSADDVESDLLIKVFAIDGSQS